MKTYKHLKGSTPSQYFSAGQSFRRMKEEGQLRNRKRKKVLQRWKGRHTSDYSRRCHNCVWLLCCILTTLDLTLQQVPTSWQISFFVTLTFPGLWQGGTILHRQHSHTVLHNTLYTQPHLTQPYYPAQKHTPTQVEGTESRVQPRVNILANSVGDGRNKQISENEEEIKVFYRLALKNEEEIRKRWGKK